MGYSSEERAEQASPEAEIRDETALRTLTKLGLIEQLSGILLSPDEYWTFSDEKREEIHEAFEKAYKDCVGHRIAPIDGALGTSLLWDKTQKKIYIFSFEICCEATVEDAWDSHVWLEWGFAKSRPGVLNMRNPLPPSVLADGTINETLWEL
ncbi:hypothetical protein EYB26_002400 [Talaromyces marneffei]|uniref:uncharacterized protein n=1 Tax=Talaromyces marneffei TaxID=37727 RepID=UPI0012A80BF1|nr:uncharacterized protein EYB26_002400 [Talaromyces marneffei]QGA14744.1 hypothetical protein EYB26_002400 [Talaromyces marneffei]